MDECFSRMELMLEKERLERLTRAHVAVFGIGGVGGALCEALARAGIGRLTIVDRDTVDITNINRQIIALRSTVGRPKAEVMRERIHEINPGCEVTARQGFFLPETADAFDFSQYSYVADAVDTVTAKLELILRAKAAGVPVISAMGAGNKLDASAFRAADISETSVCPLARVMRTELKKRGISDVRVVFSTEPPRRVILPQGQRPAAPGSVSFVPPVVGYIMAGEIIRALLGEE